MGADAVGYWSLYLAFVDGMGSLRYRGIPLALLANFYQYISPVLLARLRAGENRRSQVHQSRIQPAFDRRINSLLKPAGRKGKGERVALCTSLLRFPETVYYEYFRPEKTVILADYPVKGGGGLRYGLPVHNLRVYARDCGERVQALTRVAAKLFRRLKGYPGLADTDLQTRFLADLPEMVRLIDQADRYMQHEPPAAVLLGTTELMLTRVLALTARRRGIPSICLQHGVIAVEEAYMPVFADVQGVYGPADLNWYAQRGVKRSRLAVTGHPRYDPIYTSTGVAETELVSRLGFIAGERRVLIATQPHVPADQIERLVRLLAGDRQTRVVLKPHPLEELSGKAAGYVRLAGSLSNVTVLPRGFSLHDVLVHASCVIVESSTVGLEALLAGCPLFILQGTHSHVYERWGLPAREPEQLVKLVAQLPVRKEASASATTADNPGACLLGQLYPHRLSAPVLATWIRRVSGMDCRPRISWLRDGMLLKGEGPAIYLIQRGMRRRIAGPKQLKRLMKKHNMQVRVIKPDLLKRIPQGAPYH